MTPGGAGFVIQRRAVDRHDLPVGAGLAVGHDDVGVQVRVPAPRGLVLVGDGHQTRQPHQVFLAGARVVHPGVAGVGGQVLHRLGERGGVRVGDRLGHHIIGAQRPNQRDALGCAERQIEAVHTALTECAPVRTVGCDPVVEPARHQPRVGVSPGALGVGQTDQRRDGAGVAGQQPHRGAGFAFGVVLPQPAARPRQIPGSVLGGLGGVDVVVDRPPLELGDRQHRSHPPTAGALWHLLCHNHSRTLVQMCRAENVVVTGVTRWLRRELEE